MNQTPLRYPGGKSIMTQFFKELFKQNGLENCVYSEPYAGGAGAAVNLLLSNSVQAIRINDAAIGVFSFWHYLFEESEKFMEAVQSTPVTLGEWKKQRAIFKTTAVPGFELGFATFFLSRTNRSGILAAGPIGGQDEKAQENAKYKIDCRFNKTDLIDRLIKLVANKERITVSNLDALVFLRQINDREAFVYLDPPYYTQGKALYLNYYKHQDHVILANYLKEHAGFHWVLSYDNVPQILELYADLPLYQFGLSYTAQDIKKGSELLTHSPRLSFQSMMATRKKQAKQTIALLQITNDEEAVEKC